jgi:hypothetical protein
MFRLYALTDEDTTRFLSVYRNHDTQLFWIIQCICFCRLLFVVVVLCFVTKFKLSLEMHGKLPSAFMCIQ